MNPDSPLRRHAHTLIAADRRMIDRLSDIRRRRNMTVDEVARRMGAPENEVEAVEGDTMDPTLGWIRRYAHAVGAVVEHRVIEAQ